MAYRDVADAASRLDGVARRTPLLESPLLNERLGFRLLVKAEPLQLTGSFKFRGAYNKISRIAQPGRPVVAYSSGNHAQGVAYAAKLLGHPATIVMPRDAPAVKRANTEAYGAKVIAHDRFGEAREVIGERIVAETGAVLVKPYDDPAIMAGQGTVGLEIAQDCERFGVTPDALLCCCGGGGLIAGVATAVSHFFPNCALHACEPQGFDDTKRSLEAGERVANVPGKSSICDAILTPQPGGLTFPVNLALLAGGLSVSDAQVLQAMRAAFEHLRLVVEPGGAVALAAALSDELDLTGKTVVAVASGGNVDPGLFARALAEG